MEGKIKYPNSMSADAKDIVSKLCKVDPTQRLGNLKGAARDVKNHPWFKDIDWEKLYRREIEAPIKPHISHALDTRNFEDYDEEPERRTVYTPDLQKKFDHTFQNF